MRRHAIPRRTASQTQASEELDPPSTTNCAGWSRIDWPGTTRQTPATALVHEAYSSNCRKTSLAGSSPFLQRRRRGHARRIPIDNARHKQRQRDAVGGEQIELE